MLITSGMEDTTFYNEYMSDEIRSKDEVLKRIDKKIAKYRKKAGEDHKTPSAFYSMLDTLLETFKDRIINAVLFDTLPEWWVYSYSLEYDRFVLSMEHVKSIEFDDETGRFRYSLIDANYPLIGFGFKTLSAGEYAELYGVGDGTVRQWIRRGKLRTATKVGNEWRIPILTVPPRRGYDEAQYKWDEELEGLPEEYSYLNKYRLATFFPDRQGKNTYQVIFVSKKTVNCDDTSNNLKLTLDSKEREKLELIMIARPEIRYCLSY